MVLACDLFWACVFSLLHRLPCPDETFVHLHFDLHFSRCYVTSCMGLLQICYVPFPFFHYHSGLSEVRLRRSVLSILWPVVFFYSRALRVRGSVPSGDRVHIVHVPFNLDLIITSSYLLDFPG